LAQYTNPNQQGGGMDSSKLLTYVVIFLAFFLGMKFFLPQPAQQTQQQVPQPAAQLPAPALVAAPSAKPSAPAAAATVAAAATEIVVDTDAYRITFTNRGAQVTSWILKQSKDTHGKPLDLVHYEASSQFGFPLALRTPDPATNGELSTALFIPSATGTLVAPATLGFDYSDGNGLVAHKSFRFDNSYVLHADVTVTEQGRPVASALTWPAGFGDLELPGQYALSDIDTLSNGKEQHEASKKVSDGATLPAPLEFAGVSDQHFAAIFLPDTPDTAQLATYTHGLRLAGVKDPAPVLGAGLSASDGHLSTRLFVGPKTYALLKSVHTTGSGTSLEHIVDFGFFGPIAKALFLALFFVYEHITHNWGWAIVVLTLIINIVLMPVRISTMKSAVKMQRIQPQMEAIKAKYAKLKMTDPRRSDMNAEILQLQKDNGVNMFGGCLPSLLQLPLLIAFFSMLPKVTEMRMTHWYWLTDLTAKDQLHILPLITIVTMFVVQYSMPSPGMDPQQQKMMAFMMPAFSGFIVWNYASGLGLYWATGNLVMIAQQLVLNRTAMGREMKEIAAKRARRKAGAGVIQGKFNKR